MHNHKCIKQGSSAVLPLALRACRWATLHAVLLACSSAAAAQQLPPANPVLDLSLVLNRTTDKDSQEELQQRKERLAAAIAKLKTLEQLGDALMLRDWITDDMTNTPVAEIDRVARNQVADGFEAEVRKALRSSDAFRQQAVAARLVVMAVDARRPSDKSGYMRNRLAGLAPDLRTLLNSKDRDLRQTAIAGLVNIEKDPQTAVNVIREILIAGPKNHDAHDRLAAIRALQFFYLPPGLSSDDESMRTVLTRIVYLGAPTLPAACAAFGDPDAEVRRVAAAIVLQIADDAKNRFNPRDAGNRTAIAPLLDAFQKQSATLAASIRDKDPSVRVKLLKTLDQLAIIRGYFVGSDNVAPRGEEQSQALLPVALRQTETAKDPVLGDLPAVRDALASCLADKDVDTRIYAVQVLERLEEAALPTTPKLVGALRDPDPFVRWSAARALGVIEAARVRAKLPSVKGAEGTVDGLIALIYSKDARVRENLDLDAQIAAINALRPFGRNAAKAVPALGEVAATGDYSARLAALQNLSSLRAQGLETPPRLASITKALSDRYLDIPVPQVQIAAAELLGQYGPAAADAIPALHNALRDPEMAVRRAASDALLKITR